MGVEKVSMSFDLELGEAIRVSAGHAHQSVSSWLAGAARDLLRLPWARPWPPGKTSTPRSPRPRSPQPNRSCQVRPRSAVAARREWDWCWTPADSSPSSEATAGWPLWWKRPVAVVTGS
jgi:hypothetical protein